MRTSARILAVGVLMGGSCLALAGPSSAAPTLKFNSCPDFKVGVEVAGGNLHTQTLQNGTEIDSGTGSSLTLTNLSNGNSITLPSNGSVTQTTAPNADGTSTVTIEGHNILLLFRADTPAGPSTTLVVGRVLFTVDRKGNFNVLSISGTTTDICAALA